MINSRLALTRRSLLGVAGGTGMLAVLAACSNNDPLASETAASTDTDTVVVGSQQYYSNEIVAELYAQSLEAAGFTVERQYQIGQREVYLPEIESGAIQVLPEYAGNLLQYYDAEASASSLDEIVSALGQALPEVLTVLTPAAATDQDSYAVTQETADAYSLTSIADLTALDSPVKIAANSEFSTRPYGPDGAQALYGVELEVVAVEDSGGPLTVKALTDGDVEVADIYSSSPAIAANNLVVLEDPQNMILPQNLIPVVSETLSLGAVQAIEAVNAQLSQEQLQLLNQRSTDEGLPSSEIASDWLSEVGLL